MFTRYLENIIEKNLNRGKVIVLYGARQVGKTTLVKKILREKERGRYINCELLQNREILSSTNSEKLKFFLGDYSIIVFDEAQSIENIGKVLKIIHDELPDVQIIATGSSSFDLRNITSEPLTGRSRQFTLFPLSVKEIAIKHDMLNVNANLDNILRFGLYPGVYGLPESEAIEELENIASNYLFKDILMFERLKHADVLVNLLKAIALQIGSEVSFNELSKHIGVSVHTVKRYIDLLEKSFIIFTLTSFGNNPRKEIVRGRKIYFYDLGIRNMIIRNFNHLDSRNDTGSLWENFCIVERSKFNMYERKFVNSYFWRTYSGSEIDYVEDYDGKLYAYEFKFNKKAKQKPPKPFIDTYPNMKFKLITPDNYYEFI